MASILLPCWALLEEHCVGALPALIVPPVVLAFASTGDGVAGLPFGWTIDGLQNSVLIYLGLSSLAFVIVWLVGFLRRS